jgi:5-methylcytosine-specific restriction enzyme A
MATAGSRCDKHAAQVKREVDQRRGSSAQRGYGGAWQKARAGYLRLHPLCVHCQAEGRVTPATELDHIVPHKGDRALFWDSANWQPLCKPHHDAKTAREDGGFGNKGRGVQISARPSSRPR